MDLVEATPSDYEETCDFLAAQKGAPPTHGARHCWLYGEQPAAPAGMPTSLIVRKNGRVVGHVGAVWYPVWVDGSLSAVAHAEDYYVDDSARRGGTGYLLMRSLLDACGTLVATGLTPQSMAVTPKVGPLSRVREARVWLPLQGIGRTLAATRRFHAVAPLATIATWPLRLLSAAAGADRAREVGAEALDGLGGNVAPSPLRLDAPWLRWRLRDPSRRVRLRAALRGGAIAWWAIVVDDCMVVALGATDPAAQPGAWSPAPEGMPLVHPRTARALGCLGLQIPSPLVPEGLSGVATGYRAAMPTPECVVGLEGSEARFDQLTRFAWSLNGI